MPYALLKKTEKIHPIRIELWIPKQEEIGEIICVSNMNRVVMLYVRLLDSSGELFDMFFCGHTECEVSLLVVSQDGQF